MSDACDPIDQDDAGLLRRDASFVPLARWLAVAVFFSWTQALDAYGPFDAIENIVYWLGHERAGEVIPIYNITSLVLHVLSVLVWGAVFREVAMIVLARRRAKRERMPSREDVAEVEITTDADLGFACSMRMKNGDRVRVLARTEEQARVTAGALAPQHRDEALVFEGVGDRRARDTVRAALAVGGVVGALGVIAALFTYVGRPYDIEPYNFFYWLDWLATFAVALVGPLAALAVSPVARRLTSSRVTVSADEVVIGAGKHARRIPRASITRAVAGEGSDVVISLEGGEDVRVSFAADRPVVERDLFLERLERSEPASTTSGVRVRADEGIEDVAEITPPAREAPRATR